MNRDDRSRSQDPSAERAVEQSTQTASGLSSGPEGPGVGRKRDEDAETVNRTDADPGATPRRYDQPIQDDADPVMPEDDSTLNTKI